MFQAAPTGLRRWVALGALSLGGFAIGCSEFVAMGLLPEVAHEARRAVADTSVFAWGYALGVVIGAPLLGILSSRFARGRFLAASLVAMSVLTAATAVAPGFPAIIGARILAGVPHAAFFGVGAIVAAGLLGERHASRGVAVVLGGLTVANIVGTPVGAWLGQSLGWRPVYLGIATVFALAAAGTAWSLQGSRRPRHAPDLRGSVRALMGGRLWRTIGVYGLVNAGLFAVVTFTAPIVTEVAHLSARGIPMVLAVSGVGMTIGNYAGGALADRNRLAAVVVAGGAAGGSFAALAVAGLWGPAVFVGFFLAAYALGAVTPFVQVDLMHAAPTHPQLGSSMNSLCANAGSVTGAVCASLAIAATGGYGVAMGVGVVLTGVGFAGAAAAHRWAAPATGSPVR